MNHPAFGLIGVAAIFAIAYLLSSDRKGIRLRAVLPAFGLQVAIAVFVLFTPWGAAVLETLSKGFQALLNYSGEGINFLFGSLVPNVANNEFSFLVLVLPVIVFFGAVMEVLYHLGIMQLVVRFLGRALQFITKTRPVESLNAVANIFVGQTEAPLSLKPYLPSISKFELFTLMVSGLASIAGSVLLAYIAMGIDARYLIAACFMSAPAALLMAKIIMPDPAPTDEEIREVFAMGEDKEKRHRNVIMAAAVGTQQGLKLAVNVGAMVLVFVALIALLNGILGWFGGFVGMEDLTLQTILGFIFAPLMWLLNIPWEEAQIAGSIFGEKIITNEFIAYISLREIQETLSPNTVVILIFALCGFANLSSIGILLGGLGTLIPDRMPDIAEMGIKAVIAASLANLLNAAIAGVLVGFGGGI